MAAAKKSTPYFADKERAREAGAKGLARRRELAELREKDPAAYLISKFSAERAGLTELLLDAAFGRRTFAGSIEQHAECPGCGETVTVVVEVPSLPPDKRLSAVTKALEWAIGRPGPSSKRQEPDEEEVEDLPPGFDIK